MTYNIDRYPDRDKFLEDNECIGWQGSDDSLADKYNIWVCGVYKNKATGKYSLFITAEDDEQWTVIEFK